MREFLHRPKLRSWLIGACAGLVTAWLLVAQLSRDYLPPAPEEMEFRIRFAPYSRDGLEPLLALGSYQQADFLVVRFLNDNKVAFGYDAWGAGGPISEPVSYEPGREYRLRVRMPAFTETKRTPSAAQKRLHVVWEGRTLIDQPVVFHTRRPAELFFADNPIGGDAGAVFSGTLATMDGRVLRGDVGGLHPWQVRLNLWISTRPWQIALVILGAGAAGLGAVWLGRWMRALRVPRLAPRTFSARNTPPHVTAAAAGLACSVLFAALITQGAFRFNEPESLSSFYDYQAESLLRGRLDVPRESIGGEAFIVDGKTYGYFGVTPALLRVPIVFFHPIRGELTRLYMIAYHALCMVAAYVILLHAMSCIAGRGRYPSRWASALFIASVGAGSTYFFLGGRAYVYHEAILCGAMFALWGIHFALRYLADATGRAWIASLACGTLAANARPPAGLLALAVLGTIAAYHAWRALRAPAGNAGPSVVLRAWRPLGVGLLCVGGFATLNVISYLKFRTLDPSPLRYSVQYHAARLARFDGRNFHASNLTHNVSTYVLNRSFRFERGFPYFYLGSHGREGNFRHARMDLIEPTLAFPWAMPALFGLGTLGAAWAAVAARGPRLGLALVTLASLPMAAALFTAVVVSHRYTGDFCALFIVLGATGLAAIDADTSRLRRAWLLVISLLVATSIAINGAISLHFQRDWVWGVSDGAKQDYVRLRQRIDAWLGSKGK